MPTPIRVYLDSSDYSTLSSAGRSEEQDDIRARLIAWKDHGVVQFVFSAAHLMEMAPLAAKYTPAAVARADLLVQLCQRNALISYDRLVRSELERFAQPKRPITGAFSAFGEWYPDFGELNSPTRWVDTLREKLTLNLRDKGMNRQQRLAIRSQLFRRAGLKPSGRTLLKDFPDVLNYQEMLKTFPMREKDFRVLCRYTVGQATAAQADEAFLESLRDPSWMMRWFAEYEGQMKPLSEAIRDPGQKLVAQFRSLAEKSRDHFKALAMLGGPAATDILSDAQWEDMQIKSTCSMVTKVLERLQIAHDPVGIDAIRRYCPGLSAVVGVLHRVMRDAARENSRPPRDSDFADAVHSMYAPYVDVFRADSYMAPHVAAATNGSGVRVVQKLNQLCPAIERALSTL